MTDFLKVTGKSMIGNSIFVRYTITLLIVQGLFVCHAKIESWERVCVVGECHRANSAYRSCLAQPLDIRLDHPNYTDVQSESVFKNRPNTIAAESCGAGRRRDGDEFIPLCCPDRKSEEGISLPKCILHIWLELKMVGMLVAGMGANINEFPHQVRILIKTRRGHRETCGGTIYNKDYVLTAASCVVHDGVVVRPSTIDVIVGQNLEHERIPRNIYFVSDIKVHEGYRATVHSYGRDNDIALLRLRDPLDLPSSSSHVKALRIPEKDFRADGRNAIILGWGSKAPDGKLIGALLKHNAHVNTKEECIRKSMMALRNSPNPNTRLSIDSFSSFEDLDSFEVRPPTSLSSGRSSSRSRSRGGSLFDDDDFFNRPWGSENRQQPHLGKSGSSPAGKTLGRWATRKRQNLVRSFAFLSSSLLCLGGDGNGYSRGDSGGPAVCEGPDGSPVLCGISSYGRNEFKGEWPATYINVAHYFDWIHSNAGRQPSESLTKEVIDGEPIDTPDEASFFIRIKNKKTNITCGAALISSRTVISSSSCVPLDVRPEDLEVTSGLFSVDSKGTTHDVEGVATRETYKSYRSRLQSRNSNLGGELKGDFPQLNLAILNLTNLQGVFDQFLW
ncbi:Plasma kallikrein, partial [Orchesella cincta]